MNWKTKAFIQNAVSKIPSSLSYEFYYRLQRNFGTLKNINLHRHSIFWLSSKYPLGHLHPNSKIL